MGGTAGLPRAAPGAPESGQTAPLPVTAAAAALGCGSEGSVGAAAAVPTALPPPARGSRVTGHRDPAALPLGCGLGLRCPQQRLTCSAVTPARPTSTALRPGMKPEPPTRSPSWCSLPLQGWKPPRGECPAWCRSGVGEGAGGGRPQPGPRTASSPPKVPGGGCPSPEMAKERKERHPLRWAGKALCTPRLAASHEWAMRDGHRNGALQAAPRPSDPAWQTRRFLLRQGTFWRHFPWHGGGSRPLVWGLWLSRRVLPSRPRRQSPGVRRDVLTCGWPGGPWRAVPVCLDPVQWVGVKAAGKTVCFRGPGPAPPLPCSSSGPSWLGPAESLGQAQLPLASGFPARAEGLLQIPQDSRHVAGPLLLCTGAGPLLQVLLPWGAGGSCSPRPSSPLTLARGRLGGARVGFRRSPAACWRRRRRRLLIGKLQNSWWDDGRTDGREDPPLPEQQDLQLSRGGGRSGEQMSPKGRRCLDHVAPRLGLLFFWLRCSRGRVCLAALELRSAEVLLLPPRLGSRPAPGGRAQVASPGVRVGVQACAERGRGGEGEQESGLPLAGRAAASAPWAGAQLDPALLGAALRGWVRRLHCQGPEASG